ncbi:MAG: RNA polymerase sigma factor [Proteobacteria bacterium]|nr:RNA polymerase sigma factor [Pseudomonadota bacterium]
MENKQTWTDEALVSAVAQKDRDAFKILFERYIGKVQGLVFRYERNPEVAEELVQDIFLKLYESAGRYRPNAKFSTWFFKVAVNQCLNYRHHVKKVFFDEGRDFDATLNEYSYRTKSGQTTENPETIISQKERSTQLREAIDSLPERQKVALILQRFEGLSYAEISEIMGCSVKAVESLLQRAMTTLKESLKAYF